MVLGIGEYPAGYNANVHGPYDPARFYGKRKLHIPCNIDMYKQQPLSAVVYPNVVDKVTDER